MPGQKSIYETFLGYTLAGRRGGWGVNILEDERNGLPSYSNGLSTPKKIYRLKEDQAFSLSLELGRREKFAWHPSADTLLHSLGGGGDFVDTRYCYWFLKF